MNLSRLTVCIVTCNQRDFIAKCIQSVLEQDADVRLHVLVGDDASEDGTSEILAAWAAAHPELITHLRRPSRMGAFANMRDLISRAEGDFIARLDADDYWLPGKLAKQVTYLRTHPDCAAVYTNAITVDACGHDLGLFNDVGNARFDLASLLSSGNCLNNSSVLFRSPGKNAWLEADIQIDYRIHLWHARHGYLAHIDAPLTVYRINSSGSLMSDQHEKVRELYWEAIQSVPRNLVSDRDYAKGLGNFMRRTWLRSLRTGDFGRARTWSRRILAASPYGRTWTVTLALQSTIHALGKEALHHFDKDALGKRLRILHRR